VFIAGLYACLLGTLSLFGMLLVLVLMVPPTFPSARRGRTDSICIHFDTRVSSQHGGEGVPGRKGERERERSDAFVYLLAYRYLNGIRDSYGFLSMNLSVALHISWIH